MTDILKHYSSQPKNVISNLEKILHHGALAGTGKLVILPVDQGFEHGPIQSFSPNPKGYDPEYHVEFALKSGCNAYAAPLGFIESISSKYASKIPLILKLNHSDSLYKSSKSPISASVATPEQAKALGCVGVGFTIYPGSKKRKAQYQELALISKQAQNLGLIVVVWSYPRGEGLSQEGETAVDVVSYAAHIACQLGAHIVKVKPPSQHIELESGRKMIEKNNIPIKTLSERVRLVIQSSFNGKRIVIFSGGGTKETTSFLEEIKELKKGGAFGSIIGRNSFQRSEKQAYELLKQVMDIYRS